MAAPEGAHYNGAVLPASSDSLAPGVSFGSYVVREVNVSTDGSSPPPPPYPRAMMASAKAEMADSPLATEPGKGSVTANVSGSVQMKK